MLSVDVIIPCFNGEKFIARALTSVLNQSYKIQNIYVIDDGSTDDSVLEVLRFSALYPSVKLVSQSNLGLSAARNKGLSLIKSNYVAFLDADDVWAPNKIKNQVECMLANSDAIGVVSLYKHTFDFVNFRNGLTPRSEINSVNLLRRKSFLPGSASSLMIKSSIVNSNVLFDESLTFAEDLDFAIRLLDIGQIAICRENDVQIYTSPSGIQASQSQNPNPPIASLLKIIDRNSWRVSRLEVFLLKVDVYWQFVYRNIRLRNFRGLLRLQLREVSIKSETNYVVNLICLLLCFPLGIPRVVLRKFNS